jgi:hypothetical protein
MNQDTPGRKALYAPPALGKTPVRMIYGNLRLVVLAGLLAVASLLGGCSKPSDPAGGTSTPSEIQNPKSEILKLHWLGKKQLAADTNASAVWDIWKLPESIRLETQTLDKLATAPWRLWAGAATPLSNAPTTLLRPLLDDLVQEETYLEIQSSPEGSSEIVLAVRLPADRAAIWQANLPAILQSLSAAVATNTSLARTNDWTIVSLTSGPVPSTLVPRLFPQLLARLATNGTPHELRPTNHWIEITGNLRPLSQVLKLGWETMTNLPVINLRISGDGQNVRTLGAFDFPAALDLKLDPWSIPTNFICDPLVSFTAVRGVAGHLKKWSWWQPESYGPPPNQVFFWAQSPALWQHFLTYPVAHATNHVTALGEWVRQEWNPLFETNRVGKFDWATNKFGLVWMGVPFFKPVMEPARFGSSDYALIGLFANNATNRPVPAGLFTEFNNRTNLVYYDWELTPPQVTSWTQMSQLLRMVFGRRQLSPAMASLPWLKAITPNLGNATTVVTLDTPQRLGLIRSSVLGFTSVELHLLADWFESPEFPHGLHTQLMPRPPVPASAITNVLPAATAPN